MSDIHTYEIVHKLTHNFSKIIINNLTNQKIRKNFTLCFLLDLNFEISSPTTTKTHSALPDIQFFYFVNYEIKVEKNEKWA